MLIEDFLKNPLPKPIDNPFPHIHSDSLFDKSILRKVLEVFPDDNDPNWDGRNWEKKQYGFSVDSLHPYIREVFDVLCSKEMRGQIQEAFRTPKLYAVLAGASAHITGPWEKNTMHTDWQMYGHRLFRWINLHIFLNEDYQSAHEGELILGDERTKIQPYIGNSAIFVSTNSTPHGQSIWKRDDTRKSLAVFYFAEKPHPHFKRKLTYVERGEDECESIIASQQY